MENQDQVKKKNVYLISALVFVILFVLPLGSIYFLNSGLQYRKTSLSELADLGKIGAFEAVNQNNIPISDKLLHGKVAIVNFLSEIDTVSRNQASRMAKVHQSFNETEDVLFLSIIKNKPSVNLLDKASTLGIQDHKQWYLIGATEENWNHLYKDVFKIADPATGVALVDTSSTIRKYYNINNNPEMGRLVEQIAIVIPKQKRRGM